MRQFIKTRLRRAAVALPVSLALVVVLLPLSGCSRRPAAPPAPSRPAAAAPAPRVPTGSEVFASATTSLTTSLESARRALSRGSSDATAIAAVRGFAASLPELDRGVQADFAKTRGILAKVGSKKKDAIESRVERQYAKRRDALAKRLAAVSSAESTTALKSAIAATADYLTSITPEEPYQPLGTSLPHRIVDAHAGPPVLGTRIAPAYAPNTPGATPSTLPVTPTAADTTQTVEVQFSPEITALVASLGADPVRMYEYVRNTIDFEPYYGSRKGATETYLEGSGNDIDTASLLIALYRAAGIPARYVSGVVDVPIAKAMNWVGVEIPEAAAKLFASGGTPTTSMISGGKVKALRIEHTWAEVYVAYEDYRGAGEGTGERIWVPLDGSFKEYEEAPHVDVGQYITQAQKDAYRDVLGDSISVDATGLMTVDYHAMVAAAATLTAEASAALSAAPESENATAIAGYRAPKPIRSGVLSSQLAMRPVSVSGEWRGVPEALTTRLRFTYESSLSSASFEFEIPLADLGEKRVVLGFSPATAEDQEVLRNYGSIEQVPSYVAHYTPQLIVDSALVASTSIPVQVGEGGTLRVESIQSGQRETLCDSPVHGSGFYAIGLDLGRIAPRRVSDSMDSFLNLWTKLGNPNFDQTVFRQEQMFGAMLHAGSLAYFSEVDAIQSAIADATNVRRYRGLSGCVSGTRVVASSILGLTIGITVPGLFIDVDTDSVLQVAKSGASSESQDMVLACSLASGSASSYLEGVIWHQMLGSNSAGASTIVALQRCLADGDAVAVIQQDNVDAALAACDLPRLAAADVRAAVAGGRTALVPTAELSIPGWIGNGYVVLDPETGDAGYMLTDGSAGGATVFEATEMACGVGLWLAMTVGSFLPTDLVGFYAPLSATSGAIAGGVALFISAASIGFAAGTMEQLIEQRSLSSETKAELTRNVAKAAGAALALSVGFSAASVFTGGVASMVTGLAALLTAMLFWAYCQTVWEYDLKDAPLAN